jgi:predicted dehydrogenase
MQRRQFLETGAAAAVIGGWSAHAKSESELDSSNSRLVVGVMGMSRGKDLALELLRMEGVEVRYACDVDMQRAEGSATDLKKSGGTAIPIQDFRRMLDDKEVDAIFCAAPNHWHGPATVLACKAGKHVYVEKPASHNPQEGEWMIQAASKYGRCVQMGTQRRSSRGYREAIAKIQSGAIGKVYMARCFYNSNRGSIGSGTDSTPPSHLDYGLWQGPVPRQPFRSNVVHYNWHWFWHWGNGELGNNGVHLVDLCRWGLGVRFPTRTVSTGGRFRFQDDQETPDTQCVSWEFEGGKLLTYEGISCAKHSGGPFVSFYGFDGYLEIDGDGGYRLYDSKDKLIESVSATGAGQPEHVANFVSAVRANDPTMLQQPIEGGHQSTLLCHLGNIAHRTGRAIETEPETGRLVDPALAEAYWGRSYDADWDAQVRMP